MQTRIKEFHHSVHENVKGKNDKEILSLLKNDSSLINSLDQWERTPLFALIDTGFTVDLNFVKQLVSLGARLDVACPYKYGSNEEKVTLLHLSAYNGDIELTKYLLEQQLDINAQSSCYKNTPLITAAVMHNKELFLYLIDQGADISLTDILRRTARDFLDTRFHGIYSDEKLLKFFDDAVAAKNEKDNTSGLHKFGLYKRSDENIIDKNHELESGNNYFGCK